MDYILKMILKIKIKYINIGYLLKLFKKVLFLNYIILMLKCLAII